MKVKDWSRRQRPRPEFRRDPLSHGSRRQEVGDPYLFVLVGQTALCLLLALVAAALQEADFPFWRQVVPWYEQTITQSYQSDSPAGAFSLETLIHRYGDWKEGAEATITEVVERLTADRGTAASGEGEASSQDTPLLDQESAQEVVETFAFVGQGGMGRAPETCSYAPVLLSAALQTPVGGVLTSAYGWRSHPITGKKDFHRGVDIAAPKGSRLSAPLPGRVVEVGSSGIYGNYITMDHGNRLQTTYSHCEAIIAQEGENLKKGELLATVGSTGVSTGPHTHFELSVNGIYYDPGWVMDGLMDR